MVERRGEVMKESRLFRIIYYVLEKGHSTAPELAEKFEVSIRTIYRDIDVISSAGVPIYATQGKGGGIAISKEFVLTKSLLSEKEKEQILMSLQGIMAVGGSDEDELLYKLGSLFQTKNVNWIEVDFSDWMKTNVDQSVFELIKKAIFDKKLLSFQYFGTVDKQTSRKVAPLKLVFKSIDWYVYGYCFLRNDVRFFKLSRIKDIHIEKGEFPLNIKLPTTLMQEVEIKNTIPVVLKFHKEMAFRVYDEFSEGIKKDAQGNFIVHTQLPDNDMLYGYLGSFLDGVEVIEPIWIREKLKAKLIQMIALYKT